MPVATEDALLNFGMNPFLAALLGSNPNGQSGAGTTQTGATTLKAHSTELTTSGGATAFILRDEGPNVPNFVFTTSSTSALVYVPSGHTLNGTLNDKLTVAQNKGAMLWQYKRAFWASILTA